jgi:hypothetical protein
MGCRRSVAASAATLLSLAAASAVATLPSTASAAGGSCFYTSQWQGWRATDDRTLYIRVRMRDIYRLDLANSCMIRSPGVHLTIKVRGSMSICSPLDLDLRVSQGRHFSTPCIVKTMTKLTPEEAAALPKAARP